MQSHIDSILKTHLGEEVHGSPVAIGEIGTDLYLPAHITECAYAVFAQEISDGIDRHNLQHKGIDPFSVD